MTEQNNGEGTLEYLLDRTGGSGAIIHLNGRRYYEMDEFWWAVKKPAQVDDVVKSWRERGYYACSRYKVVRSGTSWNNGPQDMRMYSVYAAFKEASQ